MTTAEEGPCPRSLRPYGSTTTWRKPPSSTPRSSPTRGSRRSIASPKRAPASLVRWSPARLCSTAPVFAVNGGPRFPFTGAVSFLVSCTDQDEVDYYWSRLTDGGQESQCGWCKDRYGLSWQIVPERLFELLTDPEPARAVAASKAMLGMRKIVIADLEEAVAQV